MEERGKGRRKETGKRKEKRKKERRKVGKENDGGGGKGVVGGRYERSGGRGVGKEW